MSQLKQALLEVAKRCYDNQLVAGTSGNMSVFCHEQQIMYITPSSIEYRTMILDDIVAMKLDGTILEGQRRPSSEWRMHVCIYQQRQDIQSVIHTHSPNATAFAVCQQPIPVILIEMVPYLGGDVPVAQFDMPGSEALGRACLAVLHERKACLMSNHGALCIGNSLHNTYETAIYLEDAAKIYQLAKAVGTPQVLSDDIVNRMKG